MHRAFHALPPLTNSKGQPTGAVYGFLLTLFKAIKDLQANYIAACFDTAKATFRHEQFEPYKAHRVSTPDGIIAQFPIMKKVLESFAIPVFEKDGFEADDLIATIANKASKESCQIYVVSGDLDNLQLVNDKIKVYTPGKSMRESVIYDEQKVIERFGVKPSQMNDFKALVGDASDGIPGVPGIGPKIAAELIAEHGNLDNLYSELSTDTAVLKPRAKEALKQNKENAFLFRHLVQTQKDVDMGFNLETCKFGNFDQENVKAVFNELGFQSLFNRLPNLVVK